jgi:hypothetical protein
VSVARCRCPSHPTFVQFRRGSHAPRADVPHLGSNGSHARAAPARPSRRAAMSSEGRARPSPSSGRSNMRVDIVGAGAVGFATILSIVERRGVPRDRVGSTELRRDTAVARGRRAAQGATKTSPPPNGWSTTRAPRRTRARPARPQRRRPPDRPRDLHSPRRRRCTARSCVSDSGAGDDAFPLRRQQTQEVSTWSRSSQGWRFRTPDPCRTPRPSCATSRTICGTTTLGGFSCSRRSRARAPDSRSHWSRLASRPTSSASGTRISR